MSYYIYKVILTVVQGYCLTAVNPCVRHVGINHLQLPEVSHCLSLSLSLSLCLSLSLSVSLSFSLSLCLSFSLSPSLKIGGSTTCKGCSKEISGRSVVAMEFDWHIECFACNYCKYPLSGRTILFFKSVYLSISLSIYLSIYLSLPFSSSLSVSPSLSLYLSLALSLSISLSISLSL